MLKYHNYDIVFAEIPDETTLAINITGCPNHCLGCHSPWLWKDEGRVLDKEELAMILSVYGKDITCVCFMGGDQAPEEVRNLAGYVKVLYPTMKTAWYSGRDKVDSFENFDYVKIGHYDQEKGGLDKKTTNQRLLWIFENDLEDITYKFWKK